MKVEYVDYFLKLLILLFLWSFWKNKITDSHAIDYPTMIFIVLLKEGK